MSDNDVPKAFGVFKPVGHVLASFPDDDTATRAVDAFVEAGFARGDIHLMPSQDMAAQAKQHVAEAGVLASIGQELNLVKAHLALAEDGHGFVAVKAPDDAAARRIADIAAGLGADRAQNYGHLVIEEMIEPGTGEKQVSESPDRGLDAQTPTGVEGDPKPA